MALASAPMGRAMALRSTMCSPISEMTRVFVRDEIATSTSLADSSSLEDGPEADEETVGAPHGASTHAIAMTWTR